jgi:stress-induced morphogen
MIDNLEIEQTIRAALPAATVKVTDLTGGRDHFHVEVTSSLFANKPRLVRHQMVQDALRTLLAAGRIHAVTITTKEKES